MDEAGQERVKALLQARKEFKVKFPEAAASRIFFIAPSDRQLFAHLFMRELMEAEEPVEALTSDGITKSILANATEPMELDLYVTDEASILQFKEKRMFSATTLSNFSKKENCIFEY